jgi:transcriptional regulator with XRE-family HTH domain
MADTPEQLALKRAFGQRVRAAREALKLTQEELAEYASLAADTISKIERGKENPTLLTMNSVALALGKSFAGFCLPWQAAET